MHRRIHIAFALTAVMLATAAAVVSASAQDLIEYALMSGFVYP